MLDKRNVETEKERERDREREGEKVKGISIFYFSAKNSERKQI